jgi:hypothetical protein
MGSFERNGLWLGSTWAFRRFMAHHTELNDMYWSYMPLWHIGRYKTKNLNAGDSVRKALHVDAKHDDARRVPETAEKWHKNIKDFNNWVRLNALMALSSYFELYLTVLARMALLSRPGLLIGDPELADGVALLRRNVKIDTSDFVRRCTRGEWPSRRKAIKDTFGDIPTAVDENIGQLDKMREVRNGVGHAFGRDLRSLPKHILDFHPEMIRVSEARLKKWLGLTVEVARAFDEYFAPLYIGEYETFLHYHRWRKKYADPHNRLGDDRVLTEAQAYNKVLGRLHGAAPGVSFCKKLIEFYKHFPTVSA